MNNIKRIEQEIDGRATVVYEITKELTLNNIEAIFEVIKPDVEDKKNLLIKVNDVDNFDLSAIQLFESIKKSCNALGSKIVFEINLPEELADLISKSGFQEYIIA